MKINVDATLVGMDDKPILENDIPVTSLTLLKRAVMADADADGKPIASDKKITRFELYMKLRQADKDTDFSLDEVQLLDKVVLVFPTLICGQLHYLLTQK